MTGTLNRLSAKPRSIQQTPTGKRLWLLCAFGILLLPFSVAHADGRWVEVRSPNFTVVSNAGDKKARECAYELEQIRAVLGQAIRAPRETGEPAVVLLVEDDKTLAGLLPDGFKPAFGTKPLAFSSGSSERYYLALKLIYRTGVKTSSVTRPATQPENPLTFRTFAARFVRQQYGPLPYWLESGLAHFYGGTIFMTDEIRVGAMAPQVQEFLSSQKLIPLDTLLSLDRSSSELTDTRQYHKFQMQSGALVHYLYFADDLPVTRPIREILQLVKEGATSAAAVQKILGDLKPLEKKLERYLRRELFLLFPVPHPARVTLQDVPTRELTPAEVAAIFGDFHLQSRRLTEARRFFEGALRHDPELAAAHMGLGRIHFRDNDISTSLKWLRKAVAAVPDNHAAHYYLGEALAAEAAPDSESFHAARAAHLRAIQLQPRFAPAYNSLANLLLSAGQLEDAAKLSRHAIELDISTASYYLTFGTALQQLGQSEPAIQAAQQAIAGALTPDDLKAGRQLLASLTSVHPAAVHAANDPPGDDGKRPQLKRRDPGDAPPQPQAVEGVLEGVTCRGFEMGITLRTEQGLMRMRAPNFVSVEYFEEGHGKLERYEPCKKLEGRRARISYRPAYRDTDTIEIVAIEIRK